MYKEINKNGKLLDKNLSEKLQAYMQTLNFFDDNIDNYIYIYDITSGLIYLTDKIREKYPIPPAEKNGNKFSDWENIVYPKDLKFMYYYLDLLIEGKIKSFNIQYRIMDKKGNNVWVTVKGNIHKNEQTDSLLLVGYVSEMVLGRLVDSLTGLFTSEKFTEDMKESMKNTDGYLMVIGIDNFKNINITQGRVYGNEVIKKVAKAIDYYSDYPMNIYRLDGDLFAIIFSNRNQENVIDFFNSVQNGLKNICTVSAGVVSYKCGDVIDSGVLYQYAENALDQAKTEGKDRMIFFSEDNYQRNLELVELLDEMKECVKNDFKNFELLYQPQIISQSYDIYGVETLLRYNSPSRGRISPAEFIPLLEDSGLIYPVGEWILKTAISQCKEWRKYLPDFHISVNISYVQLKQDMIKDTVINLIEDAGLPGDALTLELTESMQLQNYCHFNNIFHKWKQYGIKISIDDFGTGYSSLSYLKSIDIDEVKIDRCFVDHLQHNAYNYRLLSNMIELAHSAKIRVCCEGVETVEELMALQELHTDLFQGFLFAKPYTKEQIKQYYICKDSKEYKDRKARETNFRMMKSNPSNELLAELRKEEIGSIIEGMDELIFVSDVDTYELYYLNAEGRRITGIYDYKGRKCYEILQGRDKPCEFCTNKSLREDKFHIWEAENPYLKRYYLLKDKLIPWQGKISRLEIAFDITENEIVSNSIQKRLDFESAIVEAGKILASEGDKDTLAYNVLKIMGEFTKSHRVYILKKNEKNDLWNIAWEWCADGVDSAKKYFPTSLDKINERNNDKVISTPIMRNNRLIGALAMDNPFCAKDASEFIKTMSYFLGYTMIGEETNEKLNQLLNSRYEDIINHTNPGVWSI